MMWSSLLMALPLLSLANGEANGTYFIGDEKVLQWDPSHIEAEEVDVVLFYGGDLETNWTLKTNVPNVASNDSMASVSVGTNISTSTAQLVIPSGVTGQFAVVKAGMSAQDINSSFAYFFGNLTIQQSVQFYIPGRVCTQGNRTVIEVKVTVRTELYETGYVAFAADLVTIEPDMTWKAVSSVGINDRVTLAPTRQPTTPMPTSVPTAPTSQPSQYPTILPTAPETSAVMSTAAASTTAAGNNSNITDPEVFALESLIIPNSKQSIATTPSPTTVYTTGKTVKVEQNHGRRLLETSSLRGVTLGEEAREEQPVQETTCGSVFRPSGDFCNVTVSLIVRADSSTGGPYILAIGVYDPSTNGTVELQYYGVNGNDEALQLENQFVVYNPSDVSISLTYPELNDTNIDFYAYEDVGMDVSLGENLTDLEVYVVLKKVTRFDRDPDYYYLECGSKTASEFDSFGWKTSNALLYTNNTLPDGEYEFELYWAAMDTIYVYSEATTFSEYFQLDFEGPTANISQTYKGEQEPAVQIIGDNDFYISETNEITLNTSFTIGTELFGYLEQCDNDINVSNTTSFQAGVRSLFANISNVTQCTTVEGSTYNLTYKDGVKLSLDFPSTMYKTDLDDNTTVTYLHVSTYLCDGSTLETVIAIGANEKGGKHHKNNDSGLSAGAIVGIVCAGVLVLGLAAWWLCMKKGGGDQYRQLED